jgi:hypothetical protein
MGAAGGASGVDNQHTLSTAVAPRADVRSAPCDEGATRLDDAAADPADCLLYGPSALCCGACGEVRRCT